MSRHAAHEREPLLPDCAWPADKAAPADWDIVRRFCNTENRESGADRFDDDEGLQRWLDDQSIGGTLARGDRARIVEFRELVRALAVATRDTAARARLDAELARQVESVELTLVARDGLLAAVPASSRAAGRVIATVALAILSAQRAEQWHRFKACHRCEWVFYDHSKNQSGRWCAMNVCGGRSKVAAFRARETRSARSHGARA